MDGARTRVQVPTGRPAYSQSIGPPPAKWTENPEFSSPMSHQPSILFPISPLKNPFWALTGSQFDSGGIA
jgi:hypothetical protein